MSSLADFHFIRPYWLLALVPFVFIVILLVKNKLGSSNWSSVCDADLLPYLLQEKAVNQSRWPITRTAIAVLLAISALAGPTWQRIPSPVFRNDSALVIALNLSKSMDAEDIKPSRLIRARYKIADILQQRTDGQTALLVYAGDAFTVTPLTDDTETIINQLPALTTDIMPIEGNNTKLVLEKAVELFNQSGLQKGQILLVTDNVDLDNSKSIASSLDNYHLSILGLGTTDGAPITLPEGGFLKDEQGNIVLPKLNSRDLAKLAEAGQGIYQSLTADDTDVKTLLSEIDKPVQQEGKENKNLLIDIWEDKGPWLLLLTLPLAALSFRRGLLCFALLLLLPLPKNSYAFEWQDLWQNQDQQAQQAYKNNQFEQAANLFKNPDWKAAAYYKAGAYDKALENLKSSQTEQSAYNQGNVLAQSGQLEQAIKAYEKALQLKPDDTDAQYNKELVENELKKQQQNKQNNKNEQSKEDQQQQNDAEKSDEQKPQQSEEKKTQQEQADEQKSAEKKEQQDKKDEKQAEEAKAQQAEQKKPDEAKNDKEEKKALSAQDQLSTEEQQANEQWLKRIPDDPAGLLKRKFKYQYGQRKQQSN
jgi:Ca-activated chloride channel family protein